MTLPPLHRLAPVTTLTCSLLLAACKPAGPHVAAVASPLPAPAEAPPASAAAEAPPSFIRVNTTSQSWNHGQPWEKNPPRQRGALAAVVGKNQVLTTSEMAADATFIEFESLDGTRQATARVAAVDYEANLALLELATPDKDAAFFAGTQVLDLADPPKVGAKIDVVQVEDNGQTLVTQGTLQSVDVVSSFLPDQFFMIFEVKASMQSAASSYTLPVLTNGRLAGILTSYDSKDQLCDVIATPIVSQFLADAADGEYTGFPSLGIAITRTDDPQFRRWLKLPESEGGLWLSKVSKDSAAAKAGVNKGDVLLAVDGAPIDRRGYYHDPLYGQLYWSHLIRGSKRAGDPVKLTLWRDGAKLDLTATMARRDANRELVPAYQFDTPPNFLVKGGLVFLELTQPLLESFGKDWRNDAPLNLLQTALEPDEFKAEHDRIVFLGGVIPTPATIGYEQLRSLIVKEANGKPVRDMKSLVEALRQPVDGLHSLRFDEDKLTIHLDAATSDAIDAELRQRGLPTLSRTGK